MPTEVPGASRFRILKALLALEGGGEGAQAVAGEILGTAARDELEATLPLLGVHGVAPYVFFLLSRDALLAGAPAFFVEELRVLHRESQIEHFRLLGEARRLAGIFRAGGVRAVPFKGAALFTTLYDAPGLRPMQDLDWLVRREDLARAEGLMREAGYALPDALDADEARRRHFHLAFVKHGGGTRVELHWNLADEQLFPPARLAAAWAGVRESAGDQFLRLDEPTTLLHLCVHAFKHGSLNSSLAGRAPWRHLVFDPLSGNRLIWLLDIRKLVARADGITPAAVVSLAREWGVGEAFASSLLLAQEVFGPVPGWERAPAAIGREPQGPKRLVLDLLTSGLARGDGRTVRVLERLQRLDHTRELRLIRGFDLLDLLLPRPGETWRWKASGSGVLLPLLYLYRALTGPFAIARKVLPWLRRGNRK